MRVIGGFVARQGHRGNRFQHLLHCVRLLDEGRKGPSLLTQFVALTAAENQW